MRVLIISKYLSSKEVGFEARLFAIARRFSLSNAVTIITSDSNHFASYPKFKKVYNRYDIGEIKQIVLKTLKYRKTISVNRVISWIDFEIKLFVYQFRRLESPDVIIVSSLSLLTILNGLILKFRFKSKLVFDIRDIWPLTMVEEGGFHKKNPFVSILGLIESIGYLKSDLVVGTMPNLKTHVISVTGKKDINCVCVPFGFEPSFYSQSAVSSQKAYLGVDLPKNKFIVGYAGSIGLTNGLEAIIDATKKMKNDNRFHFVFLGDGDLKNKLISDTKYQSNISFIPKANREDVQSLLVKCDLLYFSALKSKIWEYGWSPNKLIDYMMAGKPILASYSGYKSMINEAECGFFVPAEDTDALVKTLNEIILIPSLKLASMGLKGKEWIIRNRDWDFLAEKYWNSISKL